MNNMVGPSWKTHLAIKKKTKKWYLSYSELSSGLVNIFPLALLLLRQNKQHPFSPTPTSPKTVYELIPQGSSFIKKSNMELPGRGFSVTADQNASKKTHQGVHAHRAVV